MTTGVDAEFLLKSIGNEYDPWLCETRDLCLAGSTKFGQFGKEDQFFKYAKNYFGYCEAILKDTPERKKEIVKAFMKLFKKMRRNISSCTISYSVFFVLECGLDKVPFVIVKEFIRLLPAHRCRQRLMGCRSGEFLLRIHPALIAAFDAHPQLISFLESYYFYGEPLSFSTLFGYELSEKDIRILSKTGMQFETKNKSRLLRKDDLIWSYYHPSLRPIKTRRNMIPKELAPMFQKVRSNIRDCINSTFYGMYILANGENAVVDTIVAYTYDVLMSVPNFEREPNPNGIWNQVKFGCNNINCTDPGCFTGLFPNEDEREDYTLSSHIKTKSRKGQKSGTDPYAAKKRRYRMTRKRLREEEYANSFWFGKEYKQRKRIKDSYKRNRFERLAPSLLPRLGR